MRFAVSLAAVVLLPWGAALASSAPGSPAAQASFPILVLSEAQFNEMDVLDMSADRQAFVA